MLCGSHGVPLYTDLRDCFYTAPGVWSYLRCPKDGLVWLNPQPVAEDVGRLYPGYCTHTVPDSPNRTSGSLRELVKRCLLARAYSYNELVRERKELGLGWALSWIAPLRELVGGSVMWLDGSWRGQLLDVGCGNGSLVAPLLNLGWEVTGIDFDPVPANLAREQFGLTVYEGTLEDVQLPEESFDAITMHHVIEHLPDPLGTLEECFRVLKPGGKLVIVTPNFGSLAFRVFGNAWSYLDPPRHLTLFSLDTLAAFAKRARFQVAEIRTAQRHASFVWNDSRHIQRHGVHPEGIHQSQGPTLKFEGQLFLAIEWASKIIIKDAGEELVLIATKTKDFN